MAKDSLKKVTSVKASTIAMFEGTFAGVVGLFIAVLYSLNTTIDIAQSTDSVLKGLAFGLATGIVSIIVLPVIYFGMGWVVGYVQGWVFNAIVRTSGGIDIMVQE